MTLIGIIELIAQIYFAVHAGRTGRYWWIFIIIFFPLIGSVVYFFVEYLPELNTMSKVKKSRRPKKQTNIK
ncbi:MAG: hypothetical protein C0622_01700 [Desulfuromonas sp.]|nr:MAG: hypothetical protein C0622_01700 [Desulfuromonas sp.]